VLFNIEKDCEFLHLSMIEHYLPYFTSVADFVYFYILLEESPPFSSSYTPLGKGGLVRMFYFALVR